MTHKRLVKALEKKGLTPKNIENTNLWFVSTTEKELGWVVQDSDAICLCVRKLSDQDDYKTDYHAGYFVYSIKNALEGLLK